MEVTTKYDIGNQVYVLDKTVCYINMVCTECEGTGNLVKYDCKKCGHVGHTKCSSCRGYGEVPNRLLKFHKYSAVGPYVITQAQIRFAGGDPIVHYMIAELGCDEEDVIPEQNIFFFLEEAREKAEALTEKSKARADLEKTKSNT